MDRISIQDVVEARRRRLTEVVRASPCDAFVLVSDATRHWTGLSRNPVVVATGVMVTGRTWEALWPDDTGAPSPTVLGYDAELTVRRQRQVETQLPGVTGWIDTGGVVAGLREVKDAIEVTLIEFVHQALNAAVDEALSLTEPGDREDEILHRLTAALNDHLPQWDWWTAPEVLGADRTSGVSGPTASPVSTGPLHVDVSIRVQGYGARVARSHWVGVGGHAWREEERRLRRLLDTLAHEVTAGSSADVVHTRLPAVARHHGFDPSTLVMAGHGIGLRPQEPPVLAHDNVDQKLVAGSIVRLQITRPPDLVRCTLLTVPKMTQASIEEEVLA